jgi:tetratricopeptide (TPR) repeat protein
MHATRSSRFCNQRAAFVAAALAFAPLLGGCDTLSARFRAKEGVELYHKGDFAAAAAKFDEASRLDGKVPVIQLNRGTSHLAVFRATSGKPEAKVAGEQAINAYQQYLEGRPGDEKVKLALIQTFVETGRYDDAVKFFEPAISKQRPDVEALNTLAIIAVKCGKPERAQVWHQRRIEVSPDKPEGYLSFGTFLWQWIHDHPEWPHEKRKEKADVALNTLKTAIELQPANPGPYTYTNLVYKELAQSEPVEEEKKKDLDQSAKFFQMAFERQNKGK